MLPVRDAEDHVELLECKVLRLGKQEVREDPAEDVPGGVPVEGARVTKGLPELGPREGDDEVEAPGDGGGGRHSNVADVEREGLGGVGEGDRTLAGGVDDHEQVHSDGNTRQLRLTGGNVEAGPGKEETQRHQRETKKK